MRVEAYCVKCRARTVMVEGESEPESVILSNGRQAWRGHCAGVNGIGCLADPPAAVFKILGMADNPAQLEAAHFTAEQVEKILRYNAQMRTAIAQVKAARLPDRGTSFHGNDPADEGS